MKLRVFTDYDPIRIIRSVDGTSLDELSTKFGYVGTFSDVEDVDIPKDRTHRDCWEHKDGKVQENQGKVQSKLAKIEQKKSKKNMALSKLGITEDDLSSILS